jgi:hypothetical protein
MTSCSIRAHFRCQSLNGSMRVLSGAFAGGEFAYLSCFLWALPTLFTVPQLVPQVRS